MEIRFISTLTREDEDRLAEGIFEMAKGLLATLPFGYMLTIETTGGRAYQDSRVDTSTSVRESNQQTGTRGDA